MNSAQTEEEVLFDMLIELSDLLGKKGHTAKTRRDWLHYQIMTRFGLIPFMFGDKFFRSVMEQRKHDNAVPMGTEV